MQATREYIELLATGLTSTSGVKIKEGKMWRANIKTKTLEYVASDLTKLDYNVCKGLILHEVGHLKYTGDYKGNDLVEKHGEQLHKTYNAYEDIRMERQLEHQYGDFATIPLRALNESAILQIIEDSKGDITNLPLLSQFLLTTSIMYASQYIGSIGRKVGYNCENIRKPELYGKPAFLIDDKVKKVINNNYHEIDEFLYRSRRHASVQSLVDDVNTNLYPIIEELMQPKEGQKPTQNLQDHKTGQGLKPTPKKTIDKMTTKEALSVLRPYINTLATRLNDILIEDRATRYTGNKKQGKLLSKDCYKIATDDTRPFSKRITPNVPDPEIFIALDRSGSMNGKPAIYSHLGACMLYGTAKKMNININMYIYNTMASKIDNLDQYGYTNGGTADEAPLTLIDRDMRADKNNIVFIITDGATGRTSEFNRLKKSIANKNGTIYGVGIGLTKEMLKDRYDNHVAVKNVEELPSVLIGIMKKIIHR